MLNILLSLVITFGILSSGLSRPLERGLLPYSRDLDGSVTPTRDEYLREFPESPLVIHNIEQLDRNALPRRDEDGRILLTVNHRLLNAHQARFSDYINDLNEEGYDVTVLDVDGGTAEALKELLIDQGAEEGVGIIFAGQMPLAWFEQLEYFESEQQPDDQRLAEYPIDLYFADWDGEWGDSSGNGIYDHHEGAWEPEVWLGRIAAYNLSRINEDSLVAAYLDRLHAYRMGDLTLPHQALNFVDDDWIPTAGAWSEAMRLAYGLMVVETEPETTSVAGYMDRLEEGFELVQVAVHSTADSHTFWITTHSQRDYFRFNMLRDSVIPRAFFYNLFACSALSLERNLCLGALYSMKPPFGLGAVGPTKTGGMLFFEDYYRPLGEGETFGNAFKQWFIQHAREEGHQNWSRSWFYGMTYFGDPTLRLPQGLRIVQHEILDENGDSDGIADAGETCSIRMYIENRGDHDISQIRGVVRSDDPWVNIMIHGFSLDNISPGNIVENEGVILSIDPAVADNHIIALEVRLTAADREEWGDRVSFSVRNARLQPVAFSTEPAEGEPHRFVGPGEAGRLYVRFENIGGHALTARSEVLLRSLDSSFVFLSERGQIESLEPYASGITPAIDYRIREGADPSYLNLLRLSVIREGVEYGRGVIAVPLSAESAFTDDLDVFPEWVEHFPVTDGFADAWRWDSTAGETGGAIAFGGPDTLHYPAQSDAALELPLMNLDAGAELHIRHQLEVEPEYDACVVEVNRSGEWMRASPVDGYNGRSVEIGSYTGGPCWNGSFHWRDDVVRLGERGGPVRIRLRFAADAGVESAGWRIDRLSVSGTNLESTDDSMTPSAHLFLNAFPNPFNSMLKISFSAAGESELKIFSIGGELIQRFVEPSRSGVNQRIVNCSSIPPGVYFLVLGAESQTVVRKIVLVK